MHTTAPPNYYRYWGYCKYFGTHLHPQPFRYCIVQAHGHDAVWCEHIDVVCARHNTAHTHETVSCVLRNVRAHGTAHAGHKIPPMPTQ